MLLHHLHAETLTLNLVGLTDHELTAPQVDDTSHAGEEQEQNPAVTEQRRRDGQLQRSLVLAHRAVFVEHPHMQDIAAMMQRHIGDVRIGLLGLDPTVAETLEHIDEARGIMHLALVGGQLDGELVLVIAQGQLAAFVQGLRQDDAPVELVTNAYLLAEELQTTEDRRLGIADVRQ